MGKSSFFYAPYLFFTILVSVLSCEEEPKIVVPEQPNLLYIFPDQFRNASLGLHHRDPVHTPNMDKLASEGLVLTNAISNFPLCSPHRAMLMTGKLPYNNQVLTNSNSQRYKYNNSKEWHGVSFSDILIKNGYEAGYVGKLHLTSPRPIAGKDSIIWDAYTPKEDRHGFNFWYSYGIYEKYFTQNYWINDAKENKLTYINEWSPNYETGVIIDNKQNTLRNIKSFFPFLAC